MFCFEARSLVPRAGLELLSSCFCLLSAEITDMNYEPCLPFFKERLLAPDPGKVSCMPYLIHSSQVGERRLLLHTTQKSDSRGSSPRLPLMIILRRIRMEGYQTKTITRPLCSVHLPYCRRGNPLLKLKQSSHLELTLLLALFGLVSR